MKIKVKQQKPKPKTLNDLKHGTSFWFLDSLYMKLDEVHHTALGHNDYNKYNVVSLETGHLLVWTIDDPIIADVMIVDCSARGISNDGE